MKQESSFRHRKLKKALSVLLVVFGACFFMTPVAVGAPNPTECSTSQDSRHLDFWLGDWTVSRTEGQVTGSSNVSLSLDKCLVVERWEGKMGHKGENLLAYSFDDKKWHGMFADNEGRVHIFEGSVNDGSAEFRGPSSGENGQTVLNRLRIVRVTPNKIFQTWEKSNDQGKSWTTVFQGQYDRKLP